MCYISKHLPCGSLDLVVFKKKELMMPGIEKDLMMPGIEKNLVTHRVPWTKQNLMTLRISPYLMTLWISPYLMTHMGVVTYTRDKPVMDDSMEVVTYTREVVDVAAIWRVDKYNLVVHIGNEVEDKMGSQEENKLWYQLGYKVVNKLSYMGRNNTGYEVDYFEVNYYEVEYFEVACRALRKTLAFLNFSSGDVAHAASCASSEDDCLLGCDWPERKLNCTCVGLSRGQVDGS